MMANTSSSVGSPLILTPYIKEGKLSEALNLSKVGPEFNGKSHSGFFTVNPEYNSNLFFWFFEAQIDPETAPLMLWLQGGPGESAMYGLFTEFGPYQLDASLNVNDRLTSWTKTHSVIYMDSPVGAGFSHTQDDRGYARSMKDVADNLYEALLQFFLLFPKFHGNDFYVAGESYGGKYVPAISYKIHHENRQSSSSDSVTRFGTKIQKINLKGLIMGNGFTDPLTCINYGSFLFDLGLIDLKEKKIFQQEETKASEAIQAGQYSTAFKIMDKLFFASKPESRPTYLEQFTGFQALYNILRDVDPPGMVDWFCTFVQKDSVRKSIHVGSQPFFHIDLGGAVADHLDDEIFQSVKPWVEELLDASENYRILYYTGQLDICVGVPMNNALIASFNWNGAQGFENCQKTIWHVGGELAGYAKTFGPLTQVIVRNAGHRVPYDQPEWSFDMINRFTRKEGPNFGAQ